MSSPREQIEAQVRAALKAGEKEKLSTLRLLLNAIINERIRSGDEVDESTFFGLVHKRIKQRKDSTEQYLEGGRTDLAEREQREIEILDEYLPAAVDAAEVRSAIRAFIESEDLSGPQAIGPIMKEMLARFSGRADGATINQIARELLAEDA